MNYRHAFHAGNFADVIKHAVLVRILLHLREKPAPFRVIDTHAGAGVYDLAGEEASRSGEWRDGIARLLAGPVAKNELLAPYLQAVAAFNVSNALRSYPGSPAIARAFLRNEDRLVACELEPDAVASLARALKGDRRCKAIAIDGWTALRAYIPPGERRGLVLVDPSFEKSDDFPRLADAMADAHRKWATGIYLLWYPLKDRKAADAFACQLRHSAFGKVLRAEIAVDALSLNAAREGPLSACGLVIVNPPWRLDEELRLVLPQLAAALARGGAGSHRLDWLARER
jgi:23S rRNA (adenine2030-N6)-methyltransferase